MVWYTLNIKNDIWYVNIRITVSNNLKFELSRVNLSEVYLDNWSCIKPINYLFFNIIKLSIKLYYIVYYRF